jgi:hypothetical protein
LVALALWTGGAAAPLAKPKSPASKIYLSETEGDTQIQTGDKIYAARQATAFDAPGTVIETREKAHDAFVYSNGTGIYVGENTRLEISRFKQEPFRPDRNTSADATIEPSVSQSEVNVPRGFVGICTSQLLSGSAMVYSTPLALVNIRGGKIAIESGPRETIVDLLEGDLTVRAGEQDIGGTVLRPGERAIVRAGVDGQPARVTVAPIPAELMTSLDNRVSIACNSRKTVSFETIGKTNEAGVDGAEVPQEIVPKPTIPADPPSNVVISPDRLPGT